MNERSKSTLCQLMSSRCKRRSPVPSFCRFWLLSAAECFLLLLPPNQLSVVERERKKAQNAEDKLSAAATGSSDGH